MTSFNSVISEVNAFAQPLEMNFESEKKYGVCFPFLATLLLVGIIAGTTINSFIDLFSYKKITVTRRRQFQQKEFYIQAIIPMIAYKINDLTFEDFNDNFNYTINLINQQKNWYQQYTLQPCTQNHWKNISKQDYDSHNVSTYYCLKNGFGLLSTLQLEQVQILYSKLWPKNWTSFLQNETEWTGDVLLFNQRVMENQRVPFTNQLYHYSSNLMNNKFGSGQFAYTLTDMETDYSFSPFSFLKKQKITTVGYLYFGSQKIDLVQIDALFLLKIFLDKKSNDWNRNVGKITNVLSEAGGLSSALFGPIGIFVFVYYKYKLRLKLAENTFKKSKNAIKPSDYGFMKSLGYGVRGIVKPDENGKFAKECQRIEKNLYEVNSLVHVEVMLKRLEMLEGAFEYSSDKDEFACLSLLERSSMEKFRYKRVRIEYYDYIVQGRSGMTIHDARELYNGLGMGLQDFINRRLKHRMQLLKEKDQIVSEQNQSCENQAPIETGNQIVTNIVIESSPQIEAENFVLFKENKSGLNILQKVINLFADIKLEAQAIQIAPEYARIQVSLAKAFYKIREDSRAMLQQRIPIIILHRLLKVIRELWRKSQEKQLKKKQENGGMVENKDEEEEELKDWDDQFEEGL